MKHFAWCAVYTAVRAGETLNQQKEKKKDVSIQ